MIEVWFFGKSNCWSYALQTPKEKKTIRQSHLTGLCPCREKKSRWHRSLRAAYLFPYADRECV